MNVKAWNNGSYHETGAGYGLAVTPVDRDAYFDREWGCIIIEFESLSRTAQVNIDKDSFWGECRELISKDIGQWLIEHGYQRWPWRQPPVFALEPIFANRFRLSVV